MKTINPLKLLDSWLNGVTMYRLLVYGLAVLLALGVVLGFAGVLSVSGLGLLTSVAVLLVVCYGSNKLLAMTFGALPSSDSAIITALILACLVAPPTTVPRIIGVAATGLIAMASKYVLALRHKHIFNPAAIGALVASLLGFVPIIWWVGTPVMFVPVALLSLFIARKTRHGQLVSIFIVTALATLLLVGFRTAASPADVLTNGLMSWPLVFFAGVMLIEPATMPTQRYYQNLFGIIVGVIFGCQLHFGPISSSPQFALIVGNIFAFAFSSRVKLLIELVERRQLTPQSYDYQFRLPAGRKLYFVPGQYMEWTLPHHGVDARGNRRTFTIASSPTEPLVHLGVKFFEPASSFKKALQAMKPGDHISIGQLSGNFIMPSSKRQELVFIAGGIGVTPFRSMVQYMIDTRQHRPVTIFYLINEASEAAYHEVFEAAKPNGVRVVYVVAKGAPATGQHGYTGYLDEHILRHEVPGLAKTRVYISGPPAMVENFKPVLITLGVKRRQMVTDFFSGY